MDDLQRPAYHFLPPANWMNDPNGLIQWDGRYHLFYQYNPYAPVHGQIHWGHASSLDLLHWQHEPIALAPDAAGPDAGGCWSGCAVDAGGVPTLIYSGHLPGRLEAACLATSHDGLQSWQKHAANPLFVGPPPGLELEAMRDHTLWREGEGWAMLMGCGVRGVGPTVLCFHSPDLRSWHYRGPLLDPAKTDLFADPAVTVWECPDFFALDGQHVLLLSLWGGEPRRSAALVGSYSAERFTPSHAQQLDYGAIYFYAPQSFRDQLGRRIVFGWAMEGRSLAAQQAAGWAGVMSLPRELRLTTDGQLAMLPVEEVTRLRGKHCAWRDLVISEAELLVLDEEAGALLELELELQPGPLGGVGLSLRRSPDGLEATHIRYEVAAGQLVVERAQASLDETVEHTAHYAPLPLAPGEPLRLRIFVDRSILEIFANERVALTTRIYPTRSDSLGLALFAEQAAARLTTLELWQIRPIW